MVKFECQIGACHHARNGNAPAGDFFPRHRLARDEHRAVTVAHRCAVGKKRVLIGEIGVSVDRDGCHIELTTKGASIEGLDVLKLVDVLDTLGVDLSVGERVEHECVVRIRTVGEVNGPGHVFIPRLIRAC